MKRLCWIGSLAVLCAVTPALAANKVCVPQARGVPSRGGAPRWLAWRDNADPAHPRPVDANLDDPRWLGATGHSFHQGGAAEPLLSRALWADEVDGTGAAKRYLYLSFFVDLEGLDRAGTATPRDLFVGFRRPTAFAGPGGAEQAYVLQFHLRAGAVAGLIKPVHCGDSSTCDETTGTPKDFWRVYVDRGATAPCDGLTGEKFDRFVGATADTPPITWMTTATAAQDAVRFWKLDAGTDPLARTAKRWAVQLRLPVASAPNVSLEQGIPPDASFFYQGTSALTSPSPSVPAELYANVGWFPRALTKNVCLGTSGTDFLSHQELGNAAAWSGLSLFTGTRPDDCEKGLLIDTPNIGAVFNAAAGTDFAKVTPTNDFRRGGVNTVIAQVVNNGDTDVSGKILARFRLAEWGSAPWVDLDEHGLFKDMRGAEHGVCGAGALPGCANITVPHIIDTDHDGREDFIDANADGIPDVVNRAAITFPWQLGNGPDGDSELCKFGVPLASGTCADCDCGVTPNKCDKPGDAGTRAPGGVCVSKRIDHQCMFVELSAPNSDVDFVQQSSWNNMTFSKLSVVSREALIDARGLPAEPGQKEHDIYLIAMPRNMPATMPATDGAALLREATLARAEVLAAPYLADIANTPPNDLKAMADKLGNNADLVRALAAVQPAARAATNRDDGPLRERIGRLAKAASIMPRGDAERTVKLLRVVLVGGTAEAITQNAVASVGAIEAAAFLPTLEIYPFYQPSAKARTYAPMTAFTVFLSHEGTLAGMRSVIDGAYRVGENVYHLKVPVGFGRRIQVRAEAIEAAATLAPSNPRWPCAQATGCACGNTARNCGLVAMLGNTTPGLLAGVFVVRRRKRKKTS